MEKDEYQALWNKFYKYESKEKSKLSDIFANWNLEKEKFLKSPSVYNDGISFYNDFGYSSFSLFILSAISTIVAKQAIEVIRVSGVKHAVPRVFLAFDKNINKTWIKSLIKIFNRFKLNVFTLSSPENTNETVVREILKIDNFSRSIYFSENEMTKSGKIQIFNEKNQLFTFEENTKLIELLINFSEEINYDFSDQTKVISNQKISMHFISKSVAQFEKMIPAYKKDLVISGKFYDELNQSIFFNIVQKLGYKYRYSKAVNIGIIEKSFNVWSFLRVYNPKPDIMFLNNKKNMLDIYLKINGVLKHISQDFIAFLYIDFLFSFWKKNDKLKKGAVLISIETSRRVIELLENYKIPYYFENHKIYEKNVLFSYSNMQFSSGLYDNFNRNNILFLVTVIQMLNTYKSKNDLINYKYRQSEEIYSNYSHLIYKIKFPKEKIMNVFEIFKPGKKITKNNSISKVDEINYESYSKNYLVSFYLESGSHILIFYDNKLQKMVFKLESKTAPNETFLYAYFYKYLCIVKMILMLKKYKGQISSLSESTDSDNMDETHKKMDDKSE